MQNSSTEMVHKVFLLFFFFVDFFFFLTFFLSTQINSRSQTVSSCEVVVDEDKTNTNVADKTHARIKSID